MKLKAGAHIHLMGICGTAMGSLAGILKEMGYKITGSDQNVYPPISTQLESLEIPIMEGYKKENLDPQPDLVIVGNVIRKDMEEAQALLQSNIPYTSLPKAMGEFVIQDRHSVVVSGTHGKTTTTSMMSWIAEYCGLKPGFLVGGIPVNFQKSFQVPRGNYFVIEGDEYDTAFFDKVPKFIHYKPQSVILTGIEFDHVDIYKNIDEVKKAFSMLMELIPKDGNFVCYAESPIAMELSQQFHCQNIVTYGIQVGDFQAHNIHFKEGNCYFDVVHNGKQKSEIQLQTFGRHNVLNALASYVLALQLGLPEEKIIEAFKKFKGVKRRLEVIGSPNDILILEDFAHHPTAVQYTIESIKEKYPNKKLWTIFEPRSATSRRKVFQQDYIKAFAKSDVTILPEVYHAQELGEEALSSQQIIQALNEKGKEAYFIPTVDNIVLYLKEQVKPQDIIVIMSNGAFDGVYQKLLNVF